MNNFNIKQKLIAFFQQVKPVAGLAIMDDGFYFVSFMQGKGGKMQILSKKISFEHLTAEIASKILKKIKSLFGAGFSSAIVSLPSVDSHLFLFEFPLITQDEQIKEAMDLALSTLPMPEKEIYSDWMPLENVKTKKKEAVLGIARKNAVDFYLKVFEENKISPIAVETHIWSLGQFLEDGDDITMIILDQFDSLIFTIYDGKIPYFQFALPKTIFESEEDFLKSVLHFTKRLIHFVSSENSRTREIKSIIFIGEEEVEDYLRQNIGDVEFKKIKAEDIPEDPGFLIALGAAKRGLISRKNDVIVSLMPVGTEVAYERHRLFSFIDFSQKFLISFVGFLMILFAGALVMVEIFSSKINKALQKETVFPAEITEVRDKAVLFNNQVSQIAKINSSRPNWENVFLEIDKYAGFGIMINQISASEKGDVSFSGIAASRDALILLKNQISGSTVFDFEELPLSLFLNKENINFTIKGKLKDIKFLIKA